MNLVQSLRHGRAIPRYRARPAQDPLTPIMGAEADPDTSFPGRVPAFMTRAPERLQPRINGLALHGKHAKDALMDPSEWLAPHEPLQPLDAQRKFAEGK